MSWKKNAFSYGIWFVYTIMTGLALLTLGAEICGMAGFGEYMGIVLALVWTAVAGGFAFLLHGFVVGRVSFFDEKRVHFTVLGTLLAAALFGAGLFLRLRGMGDGAAYSSSIYYEAAKVTEGQGIPQSVHGAVYFYVLLLRGVFLLLGNNAVMGIWLQIVLQFGAALLLFLTVRKFAGMPAGLVTLVFCMCAPYSVRCCLELSPRMLYFFLVTAAVRYMTMGHSLAASFFAGVLAALCGYVDILGFVLLAVAIGRILCCREETWGRGRKAVGVLLCAAGAIQGFVACILLDAWFSGKPAGRVAAAWLSLYRPEKFALPVQADGSAFSAEACLLAGVMAFGIFSFWFDKERERISVAVLSVCAVMAAMCFGIFTEEIPAFFFLYLTYAVLAGIGLGQCLYAAPLKRQEAVQGTGEENPDWEILMEGRPEEQQGSVKFLENPLPLPKKHVKRVLDYTLPPAAQDDDFDYPVAADDDFDI